MARSIPLHVYIGHDAREEIASDVCETSMRLHSSAPLAVTRLVEPALRHIGLYKREWYIAGGGSQKIDQRDRKPFSTDFSFTRFLVPSLMQHDGIAAFCDSDFLWLGDIAELFDICRACDFAVMVVKRSAQVDAATKMDGMIQQPYYRKNWSSLILWDCGHPSNQRLTPFEVNGMAGQWLHGFSWLMDSEIGGLDARWNWLAGIDPMPATGEPKAVHFTRGIPSMPGCEDAPFAEHWRQVKSQL